jgi:hypothetical protein
MAQRLKVNMPAKRFSVYLLYGYTSACFTGARRARRARRDSGRAYTSACFTTELFELDEILVERFEVEDVCIKDWLDVWLQACCFSVRSLLRLLVDVSVCTRCLAAGLLLQCQASAAPAGGRQCLY